jgi:hypothetical protein
MRSSTRRRIDVGALALGAVVTAAGSVVGGAIGDQERVTGMWVGAALEDDGGAGLVEVIDYDFGLAAKHGIFRTIPGLTTDSPVTVDSATAPDGIASRTSVVTGSEPGLELKIGDPNTTINGRHRYEIDYHLPDLAAGGHLDWDAVGTEWTVTLVQSEIHVVAPWEFTGLRCSKGTGGATGGCELTQPEPGHLVATIGSLDSGEGVTIEADQGAPLAAAPRLPAPPVDAPPDPGAGLALPAGVAATAGLGASAVGSKLVRRKGRERVAAGGVADAAWAGAGGGPTGETLIDAEDLAAMATTEFAPPTEITAPMGGVILAEKVLAEHKVAWLLEAAIAGDVDLIEEGKRKARLVRTGPGRPETQALLDVLFAGRTEVELGSYDESFAQGWSQVGEMLETWQGQSGLWDPTADRRKTIIRVLGGLAAIAGLAGVVGGGALASRFGAAWLPLVAAAAIVGGLGLAAVVRGWELRVRTPNGSGWWLRVESFRRFLAGSEAFHAEEAAKRGLLREYTAWAVAVGEIGRWAAAVAASSAIPQDAGLSYVHMAPFLAASTSSTSTAPSSSGGGGGGGVGGGGGGGGGGSW